MAEATVGTGTLVRLAVRRDRWLLGAWILGLAAMAGFSASATVGLYPTQASRIEAAEAFNASAAIVALYGRVYDPSSEGALAMVKLVAFGAAIVGVLMLFVVIRHTRAEEESGRFELLSGGRLGRSAPLVAALVLAYGASLLLGVLAGLSNTAAGLPLGGSIAFGMGWAATGIAYASVGAVVAQFTTSARAARGLGLTVIAVSYLLRAVGDLAEPGPSWLSWLSPIGWGQQVRAYAGNRWWVLAFPVALAAVLVPTAFVLRARRDLGAGLRQDRPGPADGRLGTVWGLAWRLQGRALLAWAAGFALFGAVLGSMASTVGDLLTSEQIRQFIEAIGGEATLVDAFLGAELAILGAIASAYGISAAARLHTEETEGRAEPILATATGRVRWASSHYLLALVGVAALMAVAGVAIGTGAALSLGEGDRLGRLLVGALAQVPSAWVMTSLVLVLFGWVPRATPVVWGVLVAFVALGEFGTLWGAPAWLMDLSPFEHAPQLPLVSGDVLAVIALVAVAALASLAGYVGFRRRDLAG